MADYFRKRGARIGEHCEIRVTNLGDEPYLVSIGNHVFIAEGAVLHTHDGAAWIFRDRDPDFFVFGAVTIEDNCMIGRNAQILPNVKIGKNSIVGAGSVVISDIPPNSIVMGVPARPISSISKYEEKCLARWKEQRPPELDFVKSHGYKSSNVGKKTFRRHLMNLLIKQDEKEEKMLTGESELEDKKYKCEK